MHLFRPSMLAPAVAGVVFCAAAIVALPARADALADAGVLIRQEKFSQAIDVLDKHLATKPKDAQGRFLKGIALTELKKYDAATTVFLQLTQDYPELPEPYNNLAVIYAQQKQYDKARAALENAIRTHPAYATAHENLGDIYARLASQAYGKALTLDAGNASAQSKLALIQNLVVGTPSAASTAVAKPAATPPTTVALAPVETKSDPRPAARPEPRPESLPEARNESRPPEVKPVPAVAGKVTTPPPATADKPTIVDKRPVAAAAGDADSAARAVAAWADAWSRKDIRAYLAAYAPGFAVPDKRSRAAWEAERRSRIDRPGNIDVAVDQLKISLDGNAARADFRQTYRSGSFLRKTRKRLDLVWHGGRWLIQRESVGS